MVIKKLFRAALFCSLLSTFVSGLRAQNAGLHPPRELQNQPPVIGLDTDLPAPPPAQPEDWSVLRVNLANMRPVSYAVIGTSETPDFSRELLRIQWRVGDPIDLYVIKPHGVKNPPVVLYLYSYPTDTDVFRNDTWCKHATQGGFAAVGFVSALTGDRYHNRPFKEWFVSELQESLGATVHDVQMVLNYLEKRGDLDVSQVGMFGQGSGGAIAVLAAQVDPRISVLDLLNPWGDWPDWLKYSKQVPESERAAYLTPEFLKRVEKMDPVLYLPQLRLKGLRVQQVMDEPVTPDAAKEKIAASVPHGDLAQYKDLAAHRDAWLVSGLSGWIHAQMRPATPSPSGEPTSQAVAPAAAGQNASPASKVGTVQ
jgi:acetyl esterase/lipase